MRSIRLFVFALMLLIGFASIGFSLMSGNYISAASFTVLTFYHVARTLRSARKKRSIYLSDTSGNIGTLITDEDGRIGIAVDSNTIMIGGVIEGGITSRNDEKYIRRRAIDPERLRRYDESNGHHN